MSKQRRCRLCKKRPPWKNKNCPPGICKRCYHRHLWPDRPAARSLRRAGTDELQALMLDDGLEPGEAGRRPTP